MDRKLNLHLTQRDPIGAAEDLAGKRAVAMVLVDRQAEAARGRFITGGDGQAMSYREKAAEAAHCLANHNARNRPKAGAYPILESEVGVTAGDALAVARVIDARRREWKGVEARINALRLAAKAAVKAADDEAAVRAAVTAIAWPNP